MYSYIYHPKTNEKLLVTSKLGNNLINKYISQIGGGVCKNFKKNKEPKCKNQKNCKWVKTKGCLEKDIKDNKQDKNINCKILKKKSDPKCSSHESCIWVKTKGCLKKNITSHQVQKKIKIKPTKKVLTFDSPPLTKSLSPISLFPDILCGKGSRGRDVYDVKKQGVLLAKIYDGRPVDNWWASEKWDGYRAVWNGQSFKSRAGKNFDVPDWYKDIMPPNIPLDGELWLGRGAFESCGLLRRKKPTKSSELLKWENSWKVANVKYKVFDILNNDDIFENRMILLNKIVNRRNACMKKFGLSDIEPLLEFTTQTLVSKSGALKLAKKVISGGGEGIMLRKPESLYEPKRSSTLYKIKEVADTEAIITGYKPGKGKYKELLGSFICSLVDNIDISFNVSGMDDSIRKSYKTSHPVGTMITITYNGYSSRGVPRHPRYLRIRHVEAVTDI